MARRPRGFLLPLLFLPVAAALAASPLAAATSPPVYYQRYPEPGEPGDLELLREGRARVQHYAPVDVSAFNWERDSFTPYTWRMQMQELRFILPAIESPRDDDQRLARSWFMRWYAVHMVPEPATTQWGEPMTVGYRAMVLVRLLASEERRAAPDDAVIGYLRSSILAHQRDLIRESRFHDTSNHGFIAALGLFETTRVCPDSLASAVALARLESMTARAVSAGGVEKEHSAAYHFVVLDWLCRISAYLESLGGPARDTAAALAATAKRMREAGYFLQDHAGRVPPIGDTDSLRVDAYSPDYRVLDTAGGATTLFDPEAGYAIYKGSRAGPDCRYVVFRIPGERLEMNRHLHDDALSVFFSHAGETILGDAGRYSYTSSVERVYFISKRAHNTVLSSLAERQARSLFEPARDVAALADPGWTASASAGRIRWTRVVRIPATGGLLVTDTLGPAGESAGAAEAVVVWNVGSDVTAVEPAAAAGDGRAWSLTTRSGRRIRLEIIAGGSGGAGIVGAEQLRGGSDRFGGWYSPAEGVRRPVTTLAVHVRCDPTVNVTTRVQVEHGSCEIAPAAQTPGSNRSGDP